MSGASTGTRRTLRRSLVSAALALSVVAAAFTTATAAAAARRGSVWRAPRRLADTGLYSDFASRTIDARNIAYSPQYPLWSDGATKRRWIHLPRGASIDASDPDFWKFPVGTKLWKEFAWGRRVETRYLELTRQGWMYAAYRWLDDESDAVLAPASGFVTAQEVAPGRHHAIPSTADCLNCHRAARAEVLGFSTLQLSSDRDPLAPHREELEPGMPTLDSLVRRGLVRGLPATLAARPPRIEAATPRERAALGYLHANCSICHDDASAIGSLGVSLRQTFGASGRADVVSEAIRKETKFRIPGAARSVWVDPGSPSTSAVVARMRSRNLVDQMPPLGTQVADEEALRLVRGWIEQDLRPARGAEGGSRP